jgi:hypothetical protein
MSRKFKIQLTIQEFAIVKSALTEAADIMADVKDSGGTTRLQLFKASWPSVAKQSAEEWYEIRDRLNRMFGNEIVAKRWEEIED